MRACDTRGASTPRSNGRIQMGACVLPMRTGGVAALLCGGVVTSTSADSTRCPAHNVCAAVVSCSARRHGCSSSSSRSSTPPGWQLLLCRRLCPGCPPEASHSQAVQPCCLRVQWWCAAHTLPSAVLLQDTCFLQPQHSCSAQQRTLPSMTATHELVVPRSMPITSSARSAPVVLQEKRGAFQLRRWHAVITCAAAHECSTPPSSLTPPPRCHHKRERQPPSHCNSPERPRCCGDGLLQPWDLRSHHERKAKHHRG